MQRVQGLSLRNVTLTVTKGKKKIFSELGEMLFTHFGVSGPLVLSASSHMDDEIMGEYVLHIDLKPGLSPEQLDVRLLRDFEKYKNKDFLNALGDLLPRKMIPVMVRRSGIEGTSTSQPNYTSAAPEFCGAGERLYHHTQSIPPYQ